MKDSEKNRALKHMEKSKMHHEKAMEIMSVKSEQKEEKKGMKKPKKKSRKYK